MTETLAGFDPTRDLRHRETVAARDCADWLAFLEVEGKSLRTLEDYERTVALLLRLFPQKALGEFSDGDLLHVLKCFPAGSRRKCRAHLASFFRWARLTRRIEQNPLDIVPRIRRTPKRIVPTFTEAEVELLAALPSPDGALFRILFGSGIRKGEARRLKVRHVSLGTGELVVYRGKGNKDRVIEVGPKLLGAVADLITIEGLNPDDHLWYSRPGGRRRRHRIPIGEGSFHRWYDRCLTDAGVPKTGRRPHCTRHTYAELWLRNGGRLETLQVQLGHESIKTTMDEYGHLDSRDIRRDLELVEA